MHKYTYMHLEQKPHILADTVVQEVAQEPWPCVSWVPKFPLYSNWPVMQGIWAVVTASSLSCSKKCCVALSEEGEGRGAYHLPGPGTSMFLAIGRGSQVTRGLPSWPVTFPLAVALLNHLHLQPQFQSWRGQEVGPSLGFSAESHPSLLL